MTTTPSRTRRSLLTGLGIAAVGVWVWGIPRLPRLFADDMVLIPIKGAPNFQMLDGAAQLSISAAVFSGLDAPEPQVDAEMSYVQANTCEALFGRNPAKVPVALFSDFNCPNCPAMDATVLTVLDQKPGTSLHRHELPLLGQTSDVASRAVLAADLQQQYAAMHSALMRTPAVTDLAFIKDTAIRAGLDADRLLADMDRPDISVAIARSKALSRHLGLYGTPATVIGRTVVLGQKSEATVKSVVAMEMERGQACS